MAGIRIHCATCAETKSDYVSVSRRCAFCGGTLVWADGDESTAREQAGNATERDTFRCDGCPRQYRHVVRERFSGDTHWWGVKETAAASGWTDLDESDWP